MPQGIAAATALPGAGRVAVAPDPRVTAIQRLYAHAYERVLCRPRVAVGLSVAAVVLLVLTGASAPNNHTLPAPLPLRLLPPMPGLASTLATLTAITLACLGLCGLLGANSRGWRPDRRRLYAAGAAAVLLVADLTPVGSSDTASYAAYGRIAALGGDPYLTTPAQLGGSYAHMVSDTWLTTPSVYGPAATWLQEAAAQLGGQRPWLTIWLLMLANAAVFLATGHLLIRTCGDPVRAALLWTANPLLIVVLVAGGHLDTFVAALGVCAVHLARRTARPRDELLTGLLVGLACDVKISALLLAPAVLWPSLRRRAFGSAARQAAGCAAVLVAGYGWYGTHALAPLSAASHLVSVPSVWAAFQAVTHGVLGPDATRTAVALGWPVLMVLLARALHRRIAGHAAPAAAWAFAFTFAWILAAPWSMPWYTAIVWAMAACLPRGPLLRPLILTTAVLALGHNSGGHGWRW